MCPDCGYNIPFKTKKGGEMMERLHKKKCVPVAGLNRAKIEHEMGQRQANKIGKSKLKNRELKRLNARTDLDEDWKVHDVGRK